MVEGRAAGHPAAQWPVEEQSAEAVLCGVCGHELSVREYLAADGCPRCAARFNPGCALQIAAHLGDRALPIFHPMTLLDHAIRGTRP